jgi:hypothetical protein
MSLASFCVNDSETEGVTWHQEICFHYESGTIRHGLTERNVAECQPSSSLPLPNGLKRVSDVKRKHDKCVKSVRCYMTVAISHAVIVNTDFGVASLKKNVTQLVIDSSHQLVFVLATSVN